jgi:hypothetical protein
MDMAEIKFPKFSIENGRRWRIIEEIVYRGWRRVGYTTEIEIRMQRLFDRLSEKDRRRYAGIEAAKLGHGGLGYISQIFGIDPKTIRRGLEELEWTDDPEPDRIRGVGGGRKVATEEKPQLDDNFRQILAEFTAGDPMREGVLWTNLSRREISRRLWRWERQRVGIQFAT